jgi:protease I
MQDLHGKRVAILATDGFEQLELTEPKRALEAAGVTVDVVSLKSGSIRAWNETDWGLRVRVDRELKDAKADDYDALVLPGGVMNPDKLRREERVQKFVRALYDAGKPIAAICHAPWTLIDAGIAAGRRMTSYPSLQTDLKNAGADWIEEEVVVDNGLITSRKPEDLPAFNQKLLQEIGEGVHAR